jgi:hypothetical protein
MTREDMQAGGKLDRMKNNIKETEDAMRACQVAIGLIAGHIGLEVDLTPVAPDKDIHDAAGLPAHPRLPMPTVAEVLADAARPAGETENDCRPGPGGPVFHGCIS